MPYRTHVWGYAKACPMMEELSLQDTVVLGRGQNTVWSWHDT